MTSVVLVNRVRLIREAVASELRKNSKIGLIKIVSSLAEASSIMKRETVDVVVVDGKISLRQLKKFINGQSEAPCIVVSGIEPKMDDVLPFARLGASGYIRSDRSIKSWVRAISGAAIGKVTDATIAGVLNRCLCQSSVSNALDTPIAKEENVWRISERMQAHANRMGLTPRERQIADLMIHGKTNKDIARALNVEVSTVKNHVHSILGKFRIKRRVEITSALMSVSP